MSKVLPLKNFKSHFVNSDGFIFKVMAHKEIILKHKISKSGNPMVWVNGTQLNLVFVMLEYFGNKFYSVDDFSCTSFRFSITKDGYVPYSKIRVITTKSSSDDEVKIVIWKCKDKALSANQRTGGVSVISSNDVLDSLLRTDFKCFYCDRKLLKKTWELDHVQPLSRGGLNISTNIVASCKTCNRMKSTMEMMKFIHKCKFIADNFIGTDYLSELGFQHRKEDSINKDSI